MVGVVDGSSSEEEMCEAYQLLRESVEEYGKRIEVYEKGIAEVLGSFSADGDTEESTKKMPCLVVSSKSDSPASCRRDAAGTVELNQDDGCSSVASDEKNGGVSAETCQEMAGGKENTGYSYCEETGNLEDVVRRKQVSFAHKICKTSNCLGRLSEEP